MTIKEKKEKRAGLVVQMRALLNKADAEKRDLTADEQTNYNNMEADVDKFGAECDRDERLAVVENTLRGRKDHNYRPTLDNNGKPVKTKVGRKALPENYGEYLFNADGSYARVGKAGLSHEFSNTLSEGSDTEGGYLVPEEFETRLRENLVNGDPIRAAATVITTASDRNIPIETDGGTFSYVGENGAYGTSDPAFGRVVLGAFKSGGIIKVSEELIQDNFFDLESYLQRLAGRRYNTLEQTAFANGTGSGQPLGLFKTTAVGGVTVGGVTGAVSASAAITADNLVDTFHSLARAYRDQASWMTSDAMVKMIRKLKTGVSGDQTYLWQPGLTGGQPDRILNRPIFVSDGAPVPAVDGKSIVFGDWSFYTIADRLGLSLQVLRELYAANGQVGYRFNKRSDGRMTFAPAMVYFQHGPAS